MAQTLAIAGHDTQRASGALEIPTLVVHGAEDQILPVENAHLIASRIPGARLETFDGVGHLFSWSARSARPS